MFDGQLGSEEFQRAPIGPVCCASNPIRHQSARSCVFILTGMKGWAGRWQSELSISMICNYLLIMQR